jgi:membrane protein
MSGCKGRILNEIDDINLPALRTSLMSAGMKSVVLQQTGRVLYRVYDGFYRHDGWALASHIALSVLLALFPFLIFLTAMGSFFGTKEMADAIVRILIDALPEAVATPIAAEVRNVLTGQRRDLLTIGGALAVWFSSSGVESVRVGLNRAYGMEDMRTWVVTRLQSIIFVLIGAISLLALGFLVVLAPPAIAATAVWFPDLAAYIGRYDIIRYGATTAILLGGLVAVHLWLPAGQRPFATILPGIGITLVAWLAAGVLLGAYLARFSTYASTYAGFAAPMMALVFLYFLAVIFIAGGELNAAIHAERLKQDMT